MICPLPVFNLPPEFHLNSTDFLNDTSNVRSKRDLSILEWPAFQSSYRRNLLDQTDHQAGVFIEHKSRRRRSPTAELQSTDSSITMYLYLGFQMDGFPKYDNISKSLPKVILNFTVDLPKFTQGKTNEVHKYDPTTGESLKIQVNSRCIYCYFDLCPGVNNVFSPITFSLAIFF